MILKRQLCSLASLLIFSCSLPAQAAPDAFALGVKQFGAKTYPLAAASFKKAIAANPRNDSARYYYALSLHYGKDIPGAKKSYAELIRMFPDSNGAAYARNALLALDPALLRTLPAPTRVPQQQVAQAPMAGSSSMQIQNIGSSRGGGRGSNDSLPDECRVYYTLEHNCFVIDTYVNGRPMKMMFDTGAAICAFGKNNFVASGIDVPTGAATGEVHGIGDGGAQASWDATVDLKVGTIERRKFPVKVQTQMGEYPLLGQTFFQDFTYTIDNGAHSIHFVKKRNNSGSIYADPNRDPNAVPFTREHNELVINIEINGRPTKMFFDTGASVVTLTHQQCQQLGITIPEDAQVSTVQGIAGSSRARIFNVNTIKVGGITKRDFPVWVPDSEMAGCGLLGQTFYNDCQYTIDYERGFIHFMRR